MAKPATLGELRASGYRRRTVREEIRENLISKLRSGEKLGTEALAQLRTDLQRHEVGRGAQSKQAHKVAGRFERIQAVLSAHLAVDSHSLQSV